MAVIRNTTVIACTPEQAFDYLVDLRNELEWNPRVQSMEKITDGPIGVGTKYRAKWKSSPHIEVECVEHERPRRWAYHNGGPIEVRFAVRLEPVDEGTRLHAEFDARPHGWFRLVFPIFLLMIKREERANMTHLRIALERRITQ
jgi:carbon monoxide dehydrogenase subunit G